MLTYSLKNLDMGNTEVHSFGDQDIILPIVTLLPMFVAIERPPALFFATWMMAPSWTLLSAPMLIPFTSPAPSIDSLFLSYHQAQDLYWQYSQLLVPAVDL